MDMQYNMNPQQMTMQQMQMMNQMQMNPMQMNPMQMNPMQMNPMQMKAQITGPVGGTSIADLGAPSRTSQMSVQQQEHNEGSNNIFQRKRPRRKDTETDVNDMEGLVKDINRDLDKFSGSKTKSSEESDTESEKKPIRRKWFYIPEIVKEPILLTLIYLLMSQSFIKKAVAMHITYLNPNEDGNVSIIGILIYGLIMSIVYMIFKKILIG